MRKFFLGLAIGLLAGATSATAAVRLVGESGHLLGWGVTANGKEVCSDPYVSTMAHLVECD